MEKIRVLQVVGKMHRAGLETFIMNMYRNIDRGKIQFDFITHYTERGDYDDEIEKMGGKIFRFSIMEDKNLLKYFRELNIFFKEHKEYQIIHGHWATFGLFYMFFAKINGVKFRISHAHNDRTPPGIRGKIVSSLIKPMKFFSNYYFACSESAIKWLYGVNSKIVKNDEVKVIKNAIELDKFQFNSSVREKYRKELGVNESYVIGHIGRLSYQKNQIFLINMFSEIIKVDKSCILWLIGEGEDKERLKKKVNELGLQDYVLFFGNRSDIVELLYAMDVFVFPSNYEALGIVAVEAQAAGLPTIISDKIPKEAQITKLIKSLSLEDPIEKWVDQVLQYKLHDRINVHADIRNAGYDVIEEASVLEEFYLGLGK